MSGFSLIDFEFPFVKPCLKNVKAVLELLRGDDWISMDSKQSISSANVAMVV
jgi:hypothetical protein